MSSLNSTVSLESFETESRNTVVSTVLGIGFLLLTAIFLLYVMPYLLRTFQRPSTTVAAPQYTDAILEHPGQPL